MFSVPVPKDFSKQNPGRSLAGTAQPPPQPLLTAARAARVLSETRCGCRSRPVSRLRCGSGLRVPRRDRSPLPAPPCRCSGKGQHVIAEIVRVHRPAKLVRDAPERVAQLFLMGFGHGLSSFKSRSNMPPLATCGVKRVSAFSMTKRLRASAAARLPETSRISRSSMRFCSRARSIAGS